MSEQILYKLTDASGQTYGGCQWGKNITHTADGKGELCSPHWIHATTHPLLAVLLDPIQGRYLSEPGVILWEGRGVVGKGDHGLKVGCISFTTLRQIPLPVITLTQKAAFGILVSLEVYHDNQYAEWAKAWLDGLDRLQAATDAADAVARAAAWDASPKWAAETAAWAAWAKPLDLIALAEKAMTYA